MGGESGGVGGTVVAPPGPPGGGRQTPRQQPQTVCVITCRGDLGDPAFPRAFSRILAGLNKLLNTSDERVRVRKVEPWNSVRVTFTIPGDAAQRLRALALGGDSALSRLGILSVQLDPDQVISLRMGMAAAAAVAGPSGLQQQAAAAAASVASSSSAPSAPGGSEPPPAAPPVAAASAQPPAAPPPAPAVATTPAVAGPSGLARPPPAKVFPFHSMNQAAGVMRGSSYPPPPYPREQPSPLLVNLLQDPRKEEPSAFLAVRSLPRPRAPPPYPGTRPPVPQLPPVEPPAPQPPPAPPQPPDERRPPDSTDQSSSNKIQYLINPLTGVLEPMSSEDEEEDKVEESVDEDLPNGDLESAASPPQQLVPPNHVPVQQKEEKIKLRLKLDKESSVVSMGGESVSGIQSPLTSSPGYKVEMYMPKSRTNHETSTVATVAVASQQPQTNHASSLTSSISSGTGIEEPRVPPLHISLRGRNAAVVVAPKKDKKRDAKKARSKTSGEIKRIKSSKSSGGEERLSESPEPSPVSTPAPPEEPVVPPDDDIVPVRNYPSEAEVASILRSVVPHTTTHKLLDDSRLKRRESKKKMYPRLEYSNSKKGIKKGSAGSLLKTVVKTNSKEVRMMSAVNKAIHRRDSADSSNPVQANSTTSSFTGGSSKPAARNEEFRPKVNCVFGGSTNVSKPPSTEERTEVVPTKPAVVTVNLCSVASPPPAVTGDPLKETDKKDTDPSADQGVKPRNNEGGEDSGIESMDALSEKSPNQGESPQRSNGSGGGNGGGGVSGGKPASVACPESPKVDLHRTDPVEPSTLCEPKKDEEREELSIVNTVVTTSRLLPGENGSTAGGESPVPIRITPALYTYSNPEKLERRGGESCSVSSAGSGDEEDRPPTPAPDPSEHISTTPSVAEEECFSAGSNSSRRSGKSLLEQLLIDIPAEGSTTSRTNGAEARRPTRTRRVTADAAPSDRPKKTEAIDPSRTVTPVLRVGKRKISEGNDSKGDEGSPLGMDKSKLQTRSNSSNHGEDWSEDDGSSVASSDGANAGRSSVSPGILHSPRLRAKQEEPPEVTPPATVAHPSSDKNVAISRREVSVVLTKMSSRRVSVRQAKTTGAASPGPPTREQPPATASSITTTTPTNTPGPRRKTRSQAADSVQEEGGPAMKRRRTSKDVK